MATLAELRQEYASTRDAIAKLDAELSREWNEIEDKAFEQQRAKTRDENIRQDEIEQAEDELTERLKDFALRHLKNINNADDLDDLNRKIATIKSNLDNTLNRLRDLERYAAKVAKVAEAVGKVVEKAADIVL